MEHPSPTNKSGRSFQLFRVRSRFRREAARAEQEEHEGGELNLVPYLDILVNTIIFLLATTVVALPLANIRVDPIRYTDDRDPAPVARPGGGERQFALTVAISERGFTVAGESGAMNGEDGRLPTIPCLGAPPVETGTAPPPRWRPECPGGQDFEALARLARRIKSRHPGQRRVFLLPEARIPYRTVVKAMDTLRGSLTERCTGDDGCLFDRVAFSVGLR